MFDVKSKNKNTLILAIIIEYTENCVLFIHNFVEQFVQVKLQYGLNQDLMIDMKFSLLLQLGQIIKNLPFRNYII